MPHDCNPAGQLRDHQCRVAFLSHSEGKSVSAWLNEADAALYRAKQLGRNRVVADEKPLAALAPH
jgi:GGDEF domain-containing protein